MYKYANGDVYEGEWKNHLRHGSGTYTYAASHLRYIGQWATGHRVGEGQVVVVDADESKVHWGREGEALVGEVVREGGIVA